MSDFDNDLPPEDVPQPEDKLDNHELLEDHMDDSDVPNKVVIQSIIEPSKVQDSYEVSEDGAIVSKESVMAEIYDDNVGEGNAIGVVEDQEMGRGKRRKAPNHHYSGFWRHDDISSDNEI